MPQEEDQENQGFTVKDQRRFNPDGSLRVEFDREAATKKPIADSRTGNNKASASEAGPFPDSQEDTLPADFVTLVLSLASTAQMGLGIAAHPGTGKAEKNLPQARHAIDLLGMLQEKTKGNLSGEEVKLLEAVLQDLRMGYVEVAKKGS
jgi:hypothetical protein